MHLKLLCGVNGLGFEEEVPGELGVRATDLPPSRPCRRTIFLVQHTRTGLVGLYRRTVAASLLNHYFCLKKIGIRSIAKSRDSSSIVPSGYEALAFFSFNCLRCLKFR